MLVRELLADKNNRTVLNEKDREKLAFLSMDYASPHTYTSPKRWICHFFLLRYLYIALDFVLVLVYVFSLLIFFVMFYFDFAIFNFSDIEWSICCPVMKRLALHF